jgi:hypothetical protein
MDCEVGIRQLVIFHWNSRSILPKLSQLKHFLSCSNIDIIVLNETWLDTSKSFRIPGFNIIRQDSIHPHGGVAVAVNCKYQFNVIPSESTYHLQHILCSVHLGNTSLDILSVYIPPPPNGKFKIQSLNTILSTIHNKNFIIVGDFNAHHTAWGCRSSDRRGHSIYTFADNHNLVCLNDHDQRITTLPPFGQEGNVIDLAFASQSISSSCTFSVLDDPMSSNHFPLLVSIFLADSVPNNSTFPMTTSTPIHCLADINYSKVDWSLFADLCAERFHNFNINSNPITAYNEFTQQLCDILMTFRKKVSNCHTRKRKALIWWNDTCSQAVQQSKIALNSYKSYPSIENYILYKQFDAKKKRILAEQKRASWVNLCSSFNRMTPN